MNFLKRFLGLEETNHEPSDRGAVTRRYFELSVEIQEGKRDRDYEYAYVVVTDDDGNKHIRRHARESVIR